MINVFDITDFGAVGDGKTDCTAAIQTALDRAGETRDRGRMCFEKGSLREGAVAVGD